MWEFFHRHGHFGIVGSGINVQQRHMIGESDMRQPDLYTPLYILLQRTYRMSAAFMMRMVID
ncbi:hypothetical protein D3C81_2309690 [compost metagenome]